MTAQYIEGGCFCGEIRYQLKGELRNLCVCHCSSCRKAAGAPFVAWASVDRDKFEVTAGNLRIHNSSPEVERGHCEQCGTTLTYHFQGRENDLDITIASMDDAETVQPKIQIFVEDRLGWIAKSSELPAYDTVPGAEAESASESK